MNATVESCSEESDNENGICLDPSSRNVSANVSAKRSSNEMDTPVIFKTEPDDSGYSTAATSMSMSSADMASQTKSAAPIPPPSPAASRRRPSIVTEDRKHSSQSSPRASKPLQRAGSAASRRPANNRRSTVTEEVVDCTDPNCTECGPHALTNRSRRGQPSHGSSLSVSYPYDVRSQRSDPAPSTYTSPPSPTYSRQPGPYVQGPAIVQPAQTRRRSSSTTGARRPMSYSGEPGHSYWVPGMSTGYPNQSQEHGPPPSMARYSMQHQQMQHPQMAPYMMQQNGLYYPPGQPAQTSPSYEYQRPPLSARTSSTATYQARGPMVGNAPVITQPDRSEPMPSARYANSQARQEQYPPQQDESESSEFDSSSEEEEEQEEEPRPTRRRELMPPPELKAKSSRDRRPSLRHAKTTQVVNEHRRMSKSQVLPERPRVRDPRDPRTSRLSNSTGHSRSASTSRPTLIQNSSKAQSYEAQRPARVMVENSKTRRRQSYQPYGTEYDFEPPTRPRNRDSKIYYDDEPEYDQKSRKRSSRIIRDEQLEAEQKRRNRDSKIYYDDSHDAIAVQERPRRKTDASATKRSEYVERRSAMDAAEAYQQRARGNEVPLNDEVHRAALKKQTRTPSDGGSTRSDDKKSRVSRAPTTVTNGGGGEIRLRVDASAPLSVSFNGDMEGRTLQVQPVEGGMADIVIGSARDNESVYRSERGSVHGGRKFITATPRRDAEESSVRSGRSSNSRRELDRRATTTSERPANILRRRTEYY
ncbi:hypothetical protein CC80DRAFT_547102 [Byssothecium circinans]|uniref:Uncharacterized protein n=1 Tax=Byssothecium circinans TaxID=147558 RepID=A0A6A5TZJ2_9PLEO|nr:hypothetical protein CC80DRAFT_547102 [Byssothecium circinans]